MGDQEHNTALPHNTAKKEIERERERWQTRRLLIRLFGFKLFIRIK